MTPIRNTAGKQLFIEDDDGWHCGGLHLIRWGGDWRCQVGSDDGMWGPMQQTRDAVLSILSALGRAGRGSCE